MKGKFKNPFLILILVFFLSPFLVRVQKLQGFKGGEIKSYSIKMAGKDAGFCKFKMYKKEKGLYVVEGETYFEIKEGVIKHSQEKLTLSPSFTPIDYHLEVLSHPKPLKRVEAKVGEEIIFLTYTFKSEDTLIKDEKKVNIPHGNLAILDADVIEHIIILFKKYNFSPKNTKQEIVSFNAQYGSFGKLQLVDKGIERIKIGEREYNCKRISIEIEGKSVFDGWIEIRSKEVLKIADSTGVLEIVKTV